MPHRARAVSGVSSIGDMGIRVTRKVPPADIARLLNSVPTRRIGGVRRSRVQLKVLLVFDHVPLNNLHLHPHDFKVFQSIPKVPRNPNRKRVAAFHKPYNSSEPRCQKIAANGGARVRPITRRMGYGIWRRCNGCRSARIHVCMARFVSISHKL